MRHTTHNSREATRLRMLKPIMFAVITAVTDFFLPSLVFSIVIFNFSLYFFFQPSNETMPCDVLISIICLAIPIDVRIYLLKNKMKLK